MIQRPRYRYCRSLQSWYLPSASTSCAHNLMRRYVLRRFPELSRWTAPRLRRELIPVPGRLL
ncbi:hypothetical protein [Sorangium sp. So ce1024]|uniref:hypothetical protein n=1 Tax=unclassified Sorangium TaxID=2621164 RepID=UPI003F027CFD